MIKVIIHSFILETYIAPLQETTTQRGSYRYSPVTDKEEGLQKEVKFGRVGHQKGPQLKRKIIPC